MSLFRIPTGVFRWRVSVTITIAIATTFALPLPRILSRGTWAGEYASVNLALALALLAAGFSFYTNWRLTKWAGAAWLAVGTLAFGTNLTITSASELLVGPGEGLHLSQAATWSAVAAVLMTASARRPSLVFRVDPGALGTAVGIAAGTFAQLATALAPGAGVGTVGAALAPAAIVTTGAALAWNTWFHLGTSPWVREHVAAALLLVACQQSIPWVNGPDGSALSLLVATVASVLVVNTGALWLLASIVDQRRALDTLRNSMERLENGVRAERATLHEIRATVSGIGQATGLICRTDLAQDRRTELLRMIDSEAHRLQRISHLEERSGSETFDLDPVLENLVLRQRVRGQRVDWQASGHRVLAREDDVSEILSILLENCRRHASGSTVLIEVRHADGPWLNLFVSDTGHGVPAKLRERLFDWGVRSPGSAGQGIGLSMARQLARDLGGDVVLVDGVPGATFQVSLPAGESAVRVDSCGEHDVLRTA